MVYDTVHEPTRTRGVVANKSDNGKGWFPYSANKLNGFDCGALIELLSATPFAFSPATRTTLVPLAL